MDEVLNSKIREKHWLDRQGLVFDLAGAAIIAVYWQVEDSQIRIMCGHGCFAKAI